MSMVIHKRAKGGNLSSWTKCRPDKVFRPTVRTDDDQEVGYGIWHDTQHPMLWTDNSTKATCGNCRT